MCIPIIIDIVVDHVKEDPAGRTTVDFGGHGVLSMEKNVKWKHYWRISNAFIGCRKLQHHRERAKSAAIWIAGRMLGKASRILMERRY